MHLAGEFPLVLCATLGLGATGCAFITVNIDPPAPSEVISESSIGRGREVVVDIPLTDNRADRRRCGTQKNGFDMETADVVCSVPPDRWMAEALAQGLQASGFRVFTSADGLSSSAVRIHGNLQQFFVEPMVRFFTFNPEADVAVDLEVSSGTGLFARRRFYFKADAFALIGTEDRFQAASLKVTQDAVGQMVRSIASLLDRYPALGAPTAPRPVALNGDVAR